MRLRRDRQCEICEWTGPRREFMRWGPGFACRDNAACQSRYALLPRTREAFAERAARMCASLGLSPAEVFGGDWPMSGQPEAAGSR